MTENEAIRDLEYLIEEYSAYPPETGVNETIGSLQYCITALREIQQYREIGTVEQVRNQKHNLEMAYKIISDYEAIGTVEECREAVEKQTQKRCAIDSYPDHTHYKCPSCGKIQKTKYNDSTFGCILNNCSNCGQALINEDLEGTEE